MDLISVIVPIYNVEKYIRDCINSIINQTYKNLEILLIDDGSTDSSGKIADDMSKIDDRIKVFHKKNGGLSDARNYGIVKSNGKYLSFIDGDDFVSPDFIDFLYNNIVKYNVKISSCAFIHYYDDGSKKSVLFKNVNQKFNDEEGQIYLNTVGYFNASCCNKLFEASLFDDIKFPLNFTSEDLFVMYKLIHLAGGIHYNSKEKYFYRQRVGSITKNKKINFNVIDAAIEQLEYYKHNKMLNVIPYGYQKLFFAYLGVYNTLLCRENNIDRKDVYKELNNIRGKFTTKKLSKGRKLQVYLFYFNSYLYDIIFRLYDIFRKK